MEKEIVELSTTMYYINIGTWIGIGIISSSFIWVNFKWIKKFLSRKSSVIDSEECSSMGLKEENSELRKEVDKYKKELSERELNSLAEIISTVKTEVEGLKKAFHDNLKEEITDLKNFIEEKYTTKENFFLLLQLVGRIVSEVTAIKGRFYPILETSKRDLINRKIEITSEEVYNNNTEINNILTSLYQNFGMGK